MGEYVPAAEAMAERELARTERRFGRNSRPTIEPMLLLAHARVLCEGESRREGVALLDRIGRIDRMRRISPLERASLEELYGVALYRESDYDSSIVHFARSENLVADAVGTQNRRYATTLLWHGRALQSLQRNNRNALPILERAEAIVDRTMGRDNALWFLIQEKIATTSRYVWPGGTLEALGDVRAGLIRHLGPQAPRLIFTYFGLVNLYSLIGEDTEAKRICRDGIALAEANGADCILGAAYMYDVAAGIAEYEQDWNEAESLWTQCIELVTRTRSYDDPSVVFSRTNRASMWLRMGRVEDAEHEWRALDPIVRNVWGEDSDMAGSNVYWLGRAALARGDTTRARVLLNRAAEMDRHFRSQTFNNLPIRDSGYVESDLALCDWLSGRVPETFDLAIRVEAANRHYLRLLARRLSDRDALGLETRHGEGLGLALTAMLDRSAPSNATQRSFDAVVRSRAVVLDAVTARHRAAQASTDSTARAIIDTLESLQRRLTGIATLDLADPKGALAAELHDRWRRWTSQLARVEPGLARSFEGDDIGGDSVRVALPRGTRLVSFVRFDKRDEPVGSGVDRQSSTPWYVAFVLRPESPEPKWVNVGAASDVDSQIEGWLALAGNNAPSTVDSIHMRALGDSLRRLLWEPMVPVSSEDERIFIVADGAISMVPFLALPSSDGGFLIDHSSPVAYLSAERDLVAKPRETAIGHGLLVFGDPDFSEARCADSQTALEFGSGDRQLQAGDPPSLSMPFFRGHTSRCGEFRGLVFSRLDQSGAEARDVVALGRKSGMSSVLLVGPVASEESFKRFSKGRRIIHVASHGFVLSGDCLKEEGMRETPLVRAGIALAGANARAEHQLDREDGILTAEEISVLDMSGTRCVVLSSCEGGVGDFVTGEGVLGMRRAFHEAGATTLVSSLWKVDDATTRLWMREFYRNLLGRKSDPVEAAHEASLTLLQRMRQGSREPPPSSWGAFVVCGVSGKQ